MENVQTPPLPVPLKPSLRKPKISSPAKESLPEKIRAELNIEKWPAIWQPAKSKNKPTVRTLQREINLEGGTRSLTTEDQKTFYALTRYPFMALQKDGRTLHQDSIKAKMISDLVREPND